MPPKPGELEQNVKYATIKWLGAALLALVLASGHLLSGPSELDAIEAVAADVQDAIQTAQVQP